MMHMRAKFAPGGFSRKCFVDKYRIPTQIGCLHHAAQRFSQIRGDRMPIVQSVVAHNKFAFGIEYYKVRVVALGDSTLTRIATGETRRFC